MQISTLRPGLLVGLNTRITGNVKYVKNEIISDHITPEGELHAKWETDRTISDPDEYQRATEVRGKCRSLITRICSPSNFGLLCPESRRSDLEDGIRQAIALADEFNASAAITSINVSVLTGRVASDDAQAIRALNGEVSALLAKMENGIRRLDPKEIRDAASEAISLGQMLTQSASDRVRRAVEQARAAARQITKNGEIAADVAGATIRIIETSALAFIDFDEPEEFQAPVQSSALSVDFTPEEQTERVQVNAAPSIDLEF